MTLAKQIESTSVYNYSCIKKSLNQEKNILEIIQQCHCQ